MSKTFTFVAEFRGGTYCTQVTAKNVNASLEKWINKLREEKEEIKYLEDAVIEDLLRQSKIEDYKPVPLCGLMNIWFAHFSSAKGSFRVNIVQTES